jgi:putative membrane protein
MTLQPVLQLAAAPWTSWSFPPMVLAAAFASIALFVQGWRRLRRRERVDHASWGRLVQFVSGIAIMTLAIVSPIDALGERYLQSAHMLQHVLVADLGVALVVLALRGPLTVFFLPRDVLVPLARAPWLRAALAWVVRPRVVVLAWLVVLVAWHLPFLYEGALRNRALHDLQHLSFLVVGTLVWILLIDPSRHGRLSVGERVGVAAVLLFAGQTLAYVMVFSSRAFYGAYADQPDRLLGMSPLTDQKVSGVIMMVEQAITLGLFLYWMLIRPATLGASGSIERPTG